jgi:hypothetical protein
MSSTKTHETLKYLARGDLVAVQPAASNGNQVQTLSVDLSSGQAQCSEAAPLGASADDVLALIGIFNFKAGSVLAAVTQAEKVCTPSAAWCYQLESKQCALLHALNPGVILHAVPCRYVLLLCTAHIQGVHWMSRCLRLHCSAGSSAVRAASIQGDSHQADQAQCHI